MFLFWVLMYVCVDVREDDKCVTQILIPYFHMLIGSNLSGWLSVCDREEMCRVCVCVCESLFYKYIAVDGGCGCDDDGVLW